MSQSEHIKKVSVNWLSFLWSHLIAIQQARSEGNSDYALGLCVQLVDWLPTDLKEKFRKEADQIQANMKIIASGQLPAIKKETDLLIKYSMKRKLLRQYSEHALKNFIDSLCRALDEKGYYTVKQFYMEGQDLTI